MRFQGKKTCSVRVNLVYINEYCQARTVFKRTLHKWKWKYQTEETVNLDQLSKGNQNKMWKFIGKIGIAEERKSTIPMELKVNDDIIIDNYKVLNVWKSDFENLYCKW